jgi:radical SAM protein with 4Fe4S-binding SPASM domain
VFDIKFHERASDIRNRIVEGELTQADAKNIEDELAALVSERPFVFNVETTNHCNMTCVMCPRTTLMTRDKQWIEGATFEAVLDQIEPHPENDLQHFWEFVKGNYEITPDERSENAFYFYIVSRCLILHGYGEPLIDRNIVNRVQACTDRNIPTYFSCVPANLSVERAEKIMQAGLTVFKFSMDGLDDEQQQFVRGKRNNFQRSYETMIEVIKMRNEKGYKTLIVPTMIALANDSEAKEMHRRFMELWEDHDVFAYVKSQDNRWYFEDDETLENKSHYESQYCEFPWTSLSVMADGSAVPCTQDYDCEMSFGNTKEQSLKDIWNSDAYKAFRQWHITGGFPEGHKCVGRCDQKKLFQRLKKVPA